MIELTLEEVKDRIRHQWTEDTLLDVLGLSIDDLVDLLEDNILDNYEKIIDALE